MGSAQTGFNEAKINTAIGVVQEEQNNVMKVLTDGLNAIEKEMQDNWGTEKAVSWVSGEYLTAVTKLGTDVAETLAKIGTVIQQVGEAQASDTGNSVTINSAGTPTLGDITTTMYNALDSGKGYVGIYKELKPNVDAKGTELITNIKSALSKLQSRIVGELDKAFNKEGAADNVSAHATIYINKVIDIVTKGVDSLKTQLDEQIAGVETFEHSIQDAGLRGAQGS